MPDSLASAEPGLLAVGVELPGLGEGVLRRPGQTQRLLAAAQFQPEQEMAGIQFDGLLQELERQGELLVDSSESAPPARPRTSRAGASSRAFSKQ